MFQVVIMYHTSTYIGIKFGFRHMRDMRCLNGLNDVSLWKQIFQDIYTELILYNRGYWHLS
jgi:hypothetical protein